MDARTSPAPSQFAGALHGLDGREIHRVDDDRRRVKAAAQAGGLAVEHGVVVGGGFPAHAADEADGFHGLVMAQVEFGLKAAVGPLHQLRWS